MFRETTQKTGVMVEWMIAASMMQVWNGATGGIIWSPYKPEYVFATSAMAGAFFLPE
jgi:hypothetical protein